MSLNNVMDKNHTAHQPLTVSSALLGKHLHNEARLLEARLNTLLFLQQLSVTLVKGRTAAPDGT